MPWLEVAAIVVATIAIGVAWRTTRALQALAAKLDRLQTNLFETRQEQRVQQAQMEQRVAALDVAVQKTTGALRFDPGTQLVRLYEMEPRAEAVLAAFHIGGCASCAVDEHSTLAEAVRERGADLDRVLTALNTLPENGVAANLRVPNVKFNL